MNVVAEKMTVYGRKAVHGASKLPLCYSAGADKSLKMRQPYQNSRLSNARVPNRSLRSLQIVSQGRIAA